MRDDLSYLVCYQITDSTTVMFISKVDFLRKSCVEVRATPQYNKTVGKINTCHIA
ncbi:hypothetical protein KTH_56010 [Thermosporothrix hazakensis]|uniref:Uncharacterized protein n=1 Tax=Thermosporothrix sp. COM3 TaxID=2490863 RepID=A0A455SQ91_9CHLR|nr:hypothetical protein KTC_20550 [Thermosporothrix sp. COM3]GCE50732.1 hypothetical protein KTH_56010 [Thermosporothrix hazakensis]